ncbi:hypothetical protein ACFVH9_16450, partial [Streptomyces hirsutus]|uniref:hypothetical protein n=1 Tax=Streptomyces hirsutus TaxID=35620 RepID=UPI00364170D5
MDQFCRVVHVQSGRHGLPGRVKVLVRTGGRAVGGRGVGDIDDPGGHLLGEGLGPWTPAVHAASATAGGGVGGGRAP